MLIQQNFLSRVIKFPIVEILFRKEINGLVDPATAVSFFEQMKYIFYTNQRFRKKAHYYSPHLKWNIKKAIKRENLTQYGEMFEKFL